MGEGGKQAGGGQQQEERRKLVKAGVEKGDLVREQQAAPDYFWFHRWRPLFLVCRPAATSTLSSPGQKFTVAESKRAKSGGSVHFGRKLKRVADGRRFRRFRRILELTPFAETNSVESRNFRRIRVEHDGLDGWNVIVRNWVPRFPVREILILIRRFDAFDRFSGRVKNCVSPELKHATMLESESYFAHSTKLTAFRIFSNSSKINAFAGGKKNFL